MSGGGRVFPAPIEARFHDFILTRFLHEPVAILGSSPRTCFARKRDIPIAETSCREHGFASHMTLHTSVFLLCTPDGSGGCHARAIWSCGCNACRHLIR